MPRCAAPNPAATHRRRALLVVLAGALLARPAHAQPGRSLRFAAVVQAAGIRGDGA